MHTVYELLGYFTAGNKPANNSLPATGWLKTAGVHGYGTCLLMHKMTQRALLQDPEFLRT